MLLRCDNVSSPVSKNKPRFFGLPTYGISWHFPIENTPTSHRHEQKLWSKSYTCRFNLKLKYGVYTYETSILTKKYLKNPKREHWTVPSWILVDLNSECGSKSLSVFELIFLNVMLCVHRYTIHLRKLKYFKTWQALQRESFNGVSVRNYFCYCLRTHYSAWQYEGRNDKLIYW